MLRLIATFLELKMLTTLGVTRLITGEKLVSRDPSRLMGAGCKVSLAGGFSFLPTYALSSPLESLALTPGM